MRAPTEQEFKEWLMHPVTKQVLQVLHAKREELRQEWEGGSYTDYLKEGTVLTNVGNVGTCKGYAFVTDLNYETLIGELDDAEPVGAPAPGSSGPDSNV